MDNREYRIWADRYADMVYRIALNQMRNVADAEDVVQTVFLKLYLKGPESREEEHVKRWLIRVTVNECKSLFRSLWYQRVDLREARDSDAPQFESPDYASLYEAIGNLPKNCRIVIHLFYFEGYSSQEIAQILDIKEPTVRTRLTRARKLLKQQLEEEPDDAGPGTVSTHDGTGARPRPAAG